MTLFAGFCYGGTLVAGIILTVLGVKIPKQKGFLNSELSDAICFGLVLVGIILMIFSVGGFLYFL